MAYKDKEATRKYYQEYQKARRAKAKADHACAFCGDKDARTLSGRVECAFCARKRSLRRIERLKEQKQT